MTSRAAFISGDSSEDGFTSRLTQVIGKIHLLMVKKLEFWWLLAGGCCQRLEATHSSLQ